MIDDRIKESAIQSASSIVFHDAQSVMRTIREKIFSSGVDSPIVYNELEVLGKKIYGAVLENEIRKLEKAVLSNAEDIIRGRK